MKFKPYIAYTIWDNKTDELVILDGSGRECAEAMGMSYATFRSILTKVRQGKDKKWTIKQRRKRRISQTTKYRRAKALREKNNG